MRGHVPRRAALRALCALAGTAFTLFMAAGGCSLIVNRAESQCSADGDCAKFPGTMCIEGGCVAKGAPPIDAAPEVDVSRPPPITSCTTTQDCLPEHQGINWVCRKTDG